MKPTLMIFFTVSSLQTSRLSMWLANSELDWTFTSCSVVQHQQHLSICGTSASSCHVHRQHYVTPLQSLCHLQGCVNGPQCCKMVLQTYTRATYQPAALPLRGLLGLIKAALEQDVMRRLKQPRQALWLR